MTKKYKNRPKLSKIRKFQNNLVYGVPVPYTRVGGGYYGFSYWCQEGYWVTFYYIINEDTESPKYKDTKTYLCQDNYFILNVNWLYKIVEY